MPRELIDLGDLPIHNGGVTIPLTEALRRSHVDGVMVVQRGTVVYERSLTMQPETSHILQSVSKSLTAALTGVVVSEGNLDPADLVTDHLPQLDGSCWGGCTIEHLLDMRAGVAFDESDYEDTSSESYRGFRILGWLPRLEADPLPADYIAAIAPGFARGPFEYRSIFTDVLGWCLERATGEPLASLFSSRIWEPMGAATTPTSSSARAASPWRTGLLVTLPDLAVRAHVPAGRRDRRSSGRAGSGRTACASPITIDLGLRSSPDSRDMPPTAFYHDQWWVYDAEAGIYSGYGIHGQQVLVHHPSGCVVARMSSWPRPWDDGAARLGDAAAFAVCAALT